jgi:ribosomal protein S16
MTEENNLELDLERVDYWLGVGAAPSETVAGLISKARTATES